MNKLTAELLLNEKKRERIRIMENLTNRIWKSDLIGSDKCYLEKLVKSEIEGYEGTNKYGVWLWDRDSDYYCSQCDNLTTCAEYTDTCGEVHPKYNFCPYCGAEMED